MVTELSSRVVSFPGPGERTENPRGCPHVGRLASYQKLGPQEFRVATRFGLNVTVTPLATLFLPHLVRHWPRDSSKHYSFKLISLHFYDFM